VNLLQGKDGSHCFDLSGGKKAAAEPRNHRGKNPEKWSLSANRAAEQQEYYLCRRTCYLHNYLYRLRRARPKGQVIFTRLLKTLGKTHRLSQVVLTGNAHPRLRVGGFCGDYSTFTKSVPVRPKVSGWYISSAFAGGTTNCPGVVARAT
jgi:hypothetical protein